MKTTTFISAVLAAVLLLVTSTQSYAIEYIISFSASGLSSDVGSVEVQNLSKATTVIVPEGNTLTLTDVPTAVNALSADDAGIRIFQNASTGTSTLTFYASQAGNAKMAAYNLDGRKVMGQTAYLETGNNSLELSLPAGIYVVRVSGTGYAYAAKLLSRTAANTQAGIKFLSNTKVEASVLLKSKTDVNETITMFYTPGDQLLYTATSGTYISSVPDVPTGSKTTDFLFTTFPTSAIPAGTFIMGSPSTEVNRVANETQHPVTLTAFSLCKYEISNTQYASFLNDKDIESNGLCATGAYPTEVLIYPSTGQYDYGLHYNGSQWVPAAGYENAPVMRVTWYGAVEFATYMGGMLPTEAQWEYACRAGSTTPFNTGNCLTNSQANYYWAMPYNTCSNTVTAPLNFPQQVGIYGPNAYGLYDMHGNVGEWCSDLIGDYTTTDQINPTGAASGSSCVVRGGSWFNNAHLCRSAFRFSSYQKGHAVYIGFRVVFVP